MFQFSNLVKSVFLSCSVLLVAACDASFHRNDVHVISSKDAITSFPEGEIYGVVTQSKLKQSIAKEELSGMDFLSLPEQKFIKSQEWIALPLDNLNHPTLERVGHCYKVESEDENHFFIVEHVTGPFHLYSANRDGCFDKGMEVKHDYGVLYIEDGLFYVLEQSEEHFRDWAGNLNPIQRMQLGVQYTLPPGDQSVAQVQVKSSKAYHEYIRQNKNDFGFQADGMPLYVGPLSEDQQKAHRLLLLAEEKYKAFKVEQAKKDAASAVK